MALLAPALFLSGCLGQEDRPSAPDLSPPDPFILEGGSDQGLPEVTEINEAEKYPWPSLPALAARELDGRDFRVGPTLAENEAYTRYYITYISDDLKISGIMNVPKGEGPFPLLILNHGYIDPAVYTNGRGLRREQDYLARRGYVVIHPDYRGHASSGHDPESELDFRLGYISDSLNAIQAARQAGLPYIDGSRVGMLGHSMGGGVTLGSLIARPDAVRAAVLFAPVSADYRLNYERWTRTRPGLVRELRERYGNLEDDAELWHGLSARNYLDRIQAPLQIHHGEEDEAVSSEWSDDLVSWLEGAGREADYFSYPGERHEFGPAWNQVMERTAAFFDRHLKN